ncbi:MAG: hypothetical protein WDN72_08085 [Alphaproteobacteria bacterium]
MNYIFDAYGDITNSNSAGITAFTGSAPAVPHGAINVTLQSNFDGDASGGAVNLSGGNSVVIATNGGNITIGGGTTTPTGSVLSTSDAEHHHRRHRLLRRATGRTRAGVTIGVLLDATGATQGGDILINGQGRISTANNGNHGVYIGTIVQTDHSGKININGLGGGTLPDSATDYGVAIGGNGKVNNMGSGLTTITGTGGSAGVGTGNYGVYVGGSSTLQTASGMLLVNGTGGAASGISNIGIFIAGNTAGGGGTMVLAGLGGGGNALGFQVYGTGAILRNTGGNIIVRAKAGPTSTTAAAQISSSGQIATLTSGNITLLMDSVIVGSNAVNSVGSLTVAPYSTNTMSVGPSSGSTFNLADSQIADFTAASYIFGSTNAGNLTINTAHDFGDVPVTFISGGNINLAGTLTKQSGTATVNYIFEAYGDIANSGSAGITAFTGTSPVVPHGAINVTLQSDYDGLNGGAVALTASTIKTNGGNITIGGGTGTPTGSTVNADGSINTAATGFAQGDANVTASDGTNTHHPGVYLSGTLDATGASSGGNILVNGKGYNTSTSYNDGVFINGGTVKTDHAGTINVNGVGQGNTDSGTDFGTLIVGATVVNNGSGATIVTGQGGGAGSGVYNYGVYVTSTNGTLETTGSGTLYVNGAGGTGGNGQEGVVANTAYAIQSTGTGAVVVYGTGGTGGSYGRGIDINAAHGIAATNGGNITVSGFGNNVSGSSNQQGIIFNPIPRSRPMAAS